MIRPVSSLLVVALLAGLVGCGRTVGANSQSGARGTLEGRITDEAGRPVYWADISPYTPDGYRVPQEKAAVSNEEGRYGWTLSPGKYEVRITHSDYREAVKTARVQANETTRLDFTLQPR